MSHLVRNLNSWSGCRNISCRSTGRLSKMKVHAKSRSNLRPLRPLRAQSQNPCVCVYHNSMHIKRSSEVCHIAKLLVAGCFLACVVYIWIYIYIYTRSPQAIYMENWSSLRSLILMCEAEIGDLAASIKMRHKRQTQVVPGCH